MSCSASCLLPCRSSTAESSDPSQSLTSRRVRAFPKLPTVDESGLPGFEISGFIALFAPAKTPNDILTRLHGAVTNALTPEMQERLVDLGLDVDGGPAEKFSAFLKQDIARYAKIVKAANIPIQ
ncbi:MAG: hypothetical protein KIT18_05275 [Burkholderiales bacterium]|nr:hypothetical protein [Burkholderiales bacterium]